MYGSDGAESTPPGDASDSASNDGSGDGDADSGGCPADKPVLDHGVCCPAGQRNCGGACVACAPGSVCAGAACACPATSQCAPEVPAGWLGPVAADLSGQDAVCPTAYPTSISAGTTPQGAAATCTCKCGTCSGGECSVYYDQFTASDCSGTPDNTALIGSAINACNLTTPNGPLYNIRGVASTTDASCGVTKNGVNTAPPTWGTNTRICSGASATPGACTSGGLCAPLTAPKKTCVYHTGSVTCPTGYPVASTQYTGFADSRDCSCACNPSTATCAPIVSFVDTSAGCTGDTGSVFGQCDAIVQGSTHGFRINSLNVSVTGKTSFTSSGGVTATSPLTLCCTN